MAVAGGSDSLCQLTYAGFNALRSVDETPCRPFRACHPRDLLLQVVLEVAVVSAVVVSWVVGSASVLPGPPLK